MASTIQGSSKTIISATLSVLLGIGVVAGVGFTLHGASDDGREQGHHGDVHAHPGGQPTVGDAHDRAGADGRGLRLRRQCGHRQLRLAR